MQYYSTTYTIYILKCIKRNLNFSVVLTNGDIDQYYTNYIILYKWHY